MFFISTEHLLGTVFNLLISNIKPEFKLATLVSLANFYILMFVAIFKSSFFKKKKSSSTFTLFLL